MVELRSRLSFENVETGLAFKTNGMVVASLSLVVSVVPDPGKTKEKKKIEK